MTVIEPKLTVADLALLPADGKRYELIDGELFVTSWGWLTEPHGSLMHQRVLGKLHVMLHRYLEQHDLGEMLITTSVEFDEHNDATPGLICISHERLAQIERDGRLYGAPELIVEILSSGNENRRRDEVIKRQLDGKFGVDEYWIVDPEQRTIAVYRLREGVLQLHTTFAAQDQLTTPLFPDFVLAVGTMFAA